GDWAAEAAAQAEAGVQGGGAEEGVDPHPEPGRGVDLAGNRRAHRDIAERAREPVDLGASKADTLNLPLEGARLALQVGLPRNQAGEHVIAERKVGGGGDGSRPP